MSFAWKISLLCLLFEQMLFDERVETSEYFEQDKKEDEPQQTKDSAQGTPPLPVGRPDCAPHEHQFNQEDDQIQNQSDLIALNIVADFLFAQVQILPQELDHRIHRSDKRRLQGLSNTLE